jgi:hypothetical protein
VEPARVLAQLVERVRESVGYAVELGATVPRTRRAPSLSNSQSEEGASMESSGRNRWRPVAKRRAAKAAPMSPKVLPWVATSCRSERLVRRESTAPCMTCAPLAHKLPHSTKNSCKLATSQRSRKPLSVVRRIEGSNPSPSASLPPDKRPHGRCPPRAQGAPPTIASQGEGGVSLGQTDTPLRSGEPASSPRPIRRGRPRS